MVKTEVRHVKGRGSRRACSCGFLCKHISAACSSSFSEQGVQDGAQILQLHIAGDTDMFLGVRVVQ